MTSYRKLKLTSRTKNRASNDRCSTNIANGTSNIVFTESYFQCISKGVGTISELFNLRSQEQKQHKVHAAQLSQQNFLIVAFGKTCETLTVASFFFRHHWRTLGQFIVV